MVSQNENAIKNANTPLEDHLGSVGDSTNIGSPPATQTRLYKSL